MQLEIIRHADGPLLVVAGPGSGKTRVLAERFVRLVEENQVSGDRILILTYNSEAAAEMSRRVSDRLGFGDYPIFTFHAFARRALVEFGWLAGVPPFFRLLTEHVEQWLRIDAATRQIKPSYFYPPQPRRDLRPLQSFISRAKQEGVSPAVLRDWAQVRRTGQGDAHDQIAELYAQAAAVYQAVEELYRLDNVLDFDDLILKLATALKESPAFQSALADRYSYFMVDEYQDTNFTQALLLERLVPAPFNLVAVADDDQSIYKFRGASLANIHRFKRVYPDAGVMALGRNYRSTSSIVGVTTGLIEQIMAREQKPLVAQRGQGDSVRIVEAPDLASEAAWVAHECKRLVTEQGIDPDEVAIIARTNAHLGAFAHALADVDLTFRLSTSGDLFLRPEVKDLIALLGAAVNPDDNLALLRLFRLPRYLLGATSRLAVVRWLRQTGEHLVLASREDLPALSGEEWERFELLRLDVSELAAMALHASAREVVSELMTRSRHVGVMDREHPNDALEAAANVRKFAELTVRFDLDHPGANPSEFLKYLGFAALADTEEAGPRRELGGSAIRLSTAHSAKGLEFEQVFVVNAAEGRFPIRGSERLLDLPAELVEEAASVTSTVDEERRLFYVAASRAKDQLTVTYARRYTSWAREPTQPSQFVIEMRRNTPDLLLEMTAPQVVLPAVKAQVPPAVRLSDLDAYSVSEMLTFSECPRRYAYQHYFRLPEQDSRELVLGSLVHSALEEAATRRMEGFAVNPAELAGYVEAAAKAASYDKLMWPDLVEEGKEMVTRYAESSSWRDAEIIRAEMNFEVEVEGVRFKGRIDRIDRVSTGLRLVDYKSGRAKTSQEVEADRRIGRQFGLYKLAARKLLEKDVELEAHFLSAPEAVRLHKDEEQLQRDLRWAWAVSKDIREARASHRFPAKPGDFTCPICPFQLVCDERQE